jgi:hypothetical protein
VARAARTRGGARGHDTASETLSNVVAMTMHRSRPTLEEGVAPATQLAQVLEARRHGTPAVALDAAKSRAQRGDARCNG